MKLTGSFFTILCAVFSNCLYAGDTLRINLRQADSIFIASNFQLLAAEMNIEASKARIIQAKLFPNPVATADINIYDPENKKWLHTGTGGQKFFQLEQLILVGGKRRSEIELAKTNTVIATLEFQKLLRALKYRLHSDLFAAGQQQHVLSTYNNQLALLDTLLTAYEIQTSKGNLPLKDLVRLKGAYLKLNNDRAALLKSYYETQANLQTLLQHGNAIDFVFTEEDISKYIQPHPIDDLTTQTFNNRLEIAIGTQDEILARQYLDYQQKLKIPDITVQSSYDQRSGAFNNQVNAGVAIALPVWNRNQGNIKSARFKLKESSYQLEALKNETASLLRNSFSFYAQTVSEYRKAIRLYNEDFEITVNGMISNFQKRNVSIIEFIDFFEAYNEVQTELSRIKTQLVSSAEYLNLLTGKDIY